jgi:hypothetical protein
MYGPIVHPFKDNVIFAGDAGWCQEAEMSGAVMCGWKAGNTISYAMQEGLYSEEGVMPYLKGVPIDIYDTKKFFREDPLSDKLESERRLFYVAITRARSGVFIGTSSHFPGSMADIYSWTITFGCCFLDFLLGALGR